jgi:ferredoxin
VSKEEALDHVQRAREAGLVHMIGRNRIDTVWAGATPGTKLLTICNCCSCCCTVLRGRLELGLKTSFDTSRFVPGVNEALCNGCAICAEERCPAKAIDMRSDGVAVIRENDCIGCGL